MSVSETRVREKLGRSIARECSHSLPSVVKTFEPSNGRAASLRIDPSSKSLNLCAKTAWIFLGSAVKMAFRPPIFALNVVP